MLLTGPLFVLTQSRKTGYEFIVSSPQPTIQCCNTITPAIHMMTLHMTVSCFPDAIGIMKYSAHQKTDTLIAKAKPVRRLDR